jgi:hypothetical protein
VAAAVGAAAASSATATCWAALGGVLLGSLGLRLRIGHRRCLTSGLARRKMGRTLRRMAWWGWSCSADPVDHIASLPAVTLSVSRLEGGHSVKQIRRA